jgi:hypothetical protein
MIGLDGALTDRSPSTRLKEFSPFAGPPPYLRVIPAGRPQRADFQCLGIVNLDFQKPAKNRERARRHPATRQSARRRQAPPIHQSRRGRE